MSLFTVVSISKDGVRRSTTLEANSEKDARNAVERMNFAVADQEQTEAYSVSEVTKE
jgi:chorismate mutase